jgi:hypothetical protein
VDPYVLGQEQSMRAVIALARGQWARGREHASRAVQLFRERCPGASYETTHAAVFYGVARDARGLRAMGMSWTDAFARILEAGTALAMGARGRATRSSAFTSSSRLPA